MKRFIMIATALVMIFPLIAFSQSEGYYSGSYTRISYVKGDVYVQRAQDLGYEKGEMNLVVIAGDKLGTREGRAEIQLGRKNYLRLDRDTLVDMVNLPARDGDLTKLHLMSGSVYLRINTLDREKNFEIHTPDASFYVMEPGLFRVDVLENKETEFRAYNGSAEAAGEEGSVQVRDGEQVTAANGRFASSPVSLSSSRDDFGDWNSGRDSLYAQRVTRTNLPEDYSDYESELSGYGRWANEAPYGNVWVPTISDYDWRPYDYGRWVWYPIIGWTWVSYEPWGWCTYHYGRWGWRMGLGWYWIPHNHWGWGPAWVHWYHGSDHYGWCALSYYNRPAVILNNRFYDRYDRDYFPANSRSLVVVNRNQLQSPRLRDVALNQKAVERLGRIQLQASQPNIRPSSSGNRGISAEGLRALSRDNLRDVGKGYLSGQRRLSSEEIRSTVQSNRIREPGAQGASSASRSRAATNQDLEKYRSERLIRNQEPGVSSPSLQKRDGGVSSSAIRSRDDLSDSIKPMRETESRREIRSFPSRQSLESSGSGLRERSGDLSSSRIKEFSPPSSSFGSSGVRQERKIEERTVTPRTERKDSSFNAPESRSLREYQPRSSSSSPSRNNSLGGNIQERSSSREAPSVQSPQRSVIKERGTNDRGSSVKEFFSRFESRNPSSTTENSPSYSGGSSSPRSYSAPSRSDSTPSRSYSAPSRSYSAPSRSYSEPSRSYSSPSRSYSAPSRSYSAPSRSYSAPSRSSSSPSRSYSAPSRSYSAPSRSSSGSSSSRSSSSRSSSSSSRVRRK